MDVDMETSPSYFDPEDNSTRERYRRYGKRHSASSKSPYQETSVSKFSETRLLFDGQSIERRPNAALFLEDIKQEVESFDVDHSEGTPAKTQYASKRRSSIDSHGMSEVDGVADSICRVGSYALKACKHEDDALVDGGDTTFTLFASLLDSTLQGLMPIPDLILQFERSCRNVSESIRYGSNGRHRIVEDKLMRQKARLLLDEAASWSLLWFLFGKGNEELPEDLILFPMTSHLEACQFLLIWITRCEALMWVLISQALAVWHHTQRSLKKGFSNPNIVHHLDFDAPTREHAQQLPDDKKQDESLLEDVWTLLRSGRLEEACKLCRSAGQPWRAATLCPFGGLDQFPSVEALVKNGKNRTLQAIELESGIGHQWRLWKWASYCASEKIAEQDGGKYETAVYAAQCSNLKRILPICTDWESACWAMAKSWLDVQVDLELAQNWPLQVLNQQPRHLSALLQKLHSSDTVHETVARGCKEQQRQIEMNLMVGDIPNLLDLLWTWISPSEDNQDVFRPHGDPQMIRFGAHLVLVLRYLLADQMKDAFREKIMTVGDLILHMYAMFLFSKQHEELVGIYASQLARHRCIDLFVHMMELRLNGSVHVRYKIFLSAIEYLPFSPEDDSKGSFEEIIERVLSRSREIKLGKYDKSSDVAEQHRLQSLQKLWLFNGFALRLPLQLMVLRLFVPNFLLRALIHSNILFREFALISMWRPTTVDHDVSENLREFQDWSEYYSCDATYRNWLKIELENTKVSPLELSAEEKQRAVLAAKEMLNSSESLLLRKENPWLVPTEDPIYESKEPVFLELHATAMLCLPSGECMCPDATLCATLMSALYSSVSEEVVLDRQLMVNVSISARDSYCIEVVLRCLATEGDGLGLHELNDGGVLATVIAAGFKGELVRFQDGVTMEISRLDAWYSSNDGSLEGPATYIVRGLCRRCCIPEVILRCMQVSVSLMESGDPPASHNELIELVASPETGFFHLFSQHQLQEFLLFEREYSIFKMELQEKSLFVILYWLKMKL
ncbi:hypothetical protein F0562_022761 [Nyssa sinensis]|uniref:Nuclear pore complex protein n=1 Tax=Nyssa sinensis TaxID=561372 RepID=A0A5J5BFU1_9ASTE|nr:hypothetical protein F0562_022761 [Nyssa sinensis]